jgi:hypothetical protein
MSATKSKQFSITSGPSKFDLMLSLFHRKVDSQVVVEFSLEAQSYPAGVVINSLELEDGSGECWIFKGYVRYSSTSSRNVKGFYRTNARTGWMKFLD